MTLLHLQLFCTILIASCWLVQARIPPKEAEARIKACCNDRKLVKMKPQCRYLCGYGDKRNFVCKFEECVNDLQRWMYCSADAPPKNGDNKKCCVEQRVPSICHPFCEGSAPPIKDLLKSAACIFYGEQILFCHKMGLSREGARWNKTRPTFRPNEKIPTKVTKIIKDYKSLYC